MWFLRRMGERFRRPAGWAQRAFRQSPPAFGRGAAMLVDAAIVIESFAVALLFRFNGNVEPPFWSTFWPSLTAMVGFWATLTLNIPDFTRFARSQRDQFIGQKQRPLVTVVVRSAPLTCGPAWPRVPSGDPVPLVAEAFGAPLLATEARSAVSEVRHPLSRRQGKV